MRFGGRRYFGTPNRTLSSEPVSDPVLNSPRMKSPGMLASTFLKSSAVTSSGATVENGPDFQPASDNGTEAPHPPDHVVVGRDEPVGVPADSVIVQLDRCALRVTDDRPALVAGFETATFFLCEARSSSSKSRHIPDVRCRRSKSALEADDHQRLVANVDGRGSVLLTRFVGCATRCP